MFQGKEEIRKLIRFFKQRDVSLFHACQFKEFHSYLTVGGIPSHACLEQRKLPYNPMVTDANDRRNDVWDKVFVNLQDYGSIFANGREGMPNAYGPILFKVNPEAFSVAPEVAITLRSAGSSNFSRQEEALCSLAEVDRVFYYPTGPYVRFSNKLREAFPDRPTNCVESVEIHCVFPDGYLPLEYVEEVIVDPYQIKGKYLRHFVDEVKSNFRVRFGISTRSVREDRRKLYDELICFLISSISSNGIIPSLEDLLYSSSVSSDMREWAQKIFARNMAWQFDKRFAPYLCNATIRPILCYE